MSFFIKDIRKNFYYGPYENENILNQMKKNFIISELFLSDNTTIKKKYQLTITMKWK